MAPQHQLAAVADEMTVGQRDLWRREAAKDLMRAVQREREACARIVDESPDGAHIEDTAAKIRARG